MSTCSHCSYLRGAGETLSNGPGASHRFDKAHTERMGTRGDASAHDTNGLATRSQRLGLCRPLPKDGRKQQRGKRLKKTKHAWKNSSQRTLHPQSRAGPALPPRSLPVRRVGWDLKNLEIGRSWQPSSLVSFLCPSGSNFEPLLGVREGTQSRKGLNGCWSASRRCCHPWQRKVEASCPDFRSRLAESRGWHKMLKVCHFEEKRSKTSTTDGLRAEKSMLPCVIIKRM